MARGAIRELRRESYALAVETEPEKLLGVIRRAAVLASEAFEAGGYLNEVVGITAQNTALEAAAFLVVLAPEEADTMADALAAAAAPKVSPKEWFGKYLELDKELSGKGEILAELSDDATSFQIGWALNKMKGTWLGKKRFAEGMLLEPDVTATWLRREGNTFNVEGVAPAVASYLNRGGQLVPPPKNRAAAIQAVFGEPRIPFEHEFRDGGLKHGDLWAFIEHAVNERTRDARLMHWFGKPL